MAVRTLIEVPDPRLREISKPVARVDDDLRALMDDMLETMYAENGIGLAAIQVGVAKRVIVMDLAREDKNGSGKAQLYYFVNPEILWHSDELSSYTEGCLSVPEFFYDIDRPARCQIGFLDYHGEAQKLDCDGLLATCIQHEMDHLEGILFIDYLSRLKRQMILKKIKKRQSAPLDERKPAARAVAF